MSHLPYIRDPDFKPFCYEIPVLLDLSGFTPEERQGEPLKQPAFLFAYRESGRYRLMVWAHPQMFSDCTFETLWTDSHTGSWKGGIDKWSHKEFCQYCQFLTSFTLGNPVTFYDNNFVPVAEFSPEAQYCLEYSRHDLLMKEKAGEVIH